MCFPQLETRVAARDESGLAQVAEIRPPGGPECSAAWLSLRLGASLHSVLLVPAELNSVSDSSRRHSPTKRIGSVNATWGGVRWVWRVE